MIAQPRRRIALSDRDYSRYGLPFAGIIGLDGLGDDSARGVALLKVLAFSGDGSRDVACTGHQ